MHFIILLYKAGLVFNFTFIYLVRWIQAFILQDWSYCGVHWRIHWVQTRVWGAKLLINFLSVTFTNVKKAEQKKNKKSHLCCMFHLDFQNCCLKLISLRGREKKLQPSEKISTSMNKSQLVFKGKKILPWKSGTGSSWGTRTWPEFWCSSELTAS